jgi:hypothetical protein
MYNTFISSRSDIFGSQFIWVGWDWVHLVRRPLFGLVYQPWIFDDDECAGIGETEAVVENLSQRRFVHHKFHMTWLGIEHVPPR